MSIDFALLLLRLVVGLLVAGHGAQKLFGWFGGFGLAGTAGWLRSIGLRPPVPWALLAGFSEFGGGLLLAGGFLAPLGSLGVLAAMLTAVVLVHGPRILSDNSMEYPLVNGAVAFVVGLVGPGAYALDAVWGTALPTPVVFWAGLLPVIGGVLTTVAMSTSFRRQAASAEPVEVEVRRAA
jgi:putative oxidoreductase